ncbi:MAG: discoidin domain-containing protein [Janthinobacterium lividum]
MLTSTKGCRRPFHRRAQALPGWLPRAAAFLALLLLGQATPAWAQCEKLAWADEFNGPGIDQSKWSFEINGDGQGTGQLDYTTDRPENAKIVNGQLVLSILKEEYKGLHYTSARLRTYRKFDTQYGRIEARVKGVYSQGNGFAFWMLGSDYETVTWPKCGEIDIFENTGRLPSHNIGTAHFAGPDGGDQMSQGSVDLPNGQRWADDFHVAGIEWSPTHITWTMDGKPYHTLDLTNPLNGYRPFNRPFFLLLSVGMGGGYSGNPDATTVSPMSATIDWVHVYKGTYSTYISSTDKLDQGVDKVYKGAQGKQYTVSSVDGGTYAWTVPAGATIIAGQGTSAITVDWGQSGGDVAVQITSPCNATPNTYKLNVTVEEPLVVDKVYENFEVAPAFTYTTLSGTLTKGVPNPLVNSINASPKVGKYLRNAGAQYDVIGMQGVNVQPAGDFVFGQRRMLLDVYTDAPPGTRVTLNFENSKAATAGNYPTGRYATFGAVTSRQNQWETLEFAYTGTPDGYASASDVDQLILMFAPVTSTGNVYYYDNLRSGQAGGTPRTLGSQVLQNFDGTNLLTKDFSNGTYTVQANPAAGAPNPSATVAKYVRDAGTSYDALVYLTKAITDARPFRLGTSKLSMDVYTDAPVGTKLSLNFEVSTASTPSNYPTGRYASFEAVTTKQNQWQTVTFALSSIPDAGASDAAVDKLVFLLNPVSSTSNTYYLDNLTINSTAPKENLTQAAIWEDYDGNDHLALNATTTGTYTAGVANPAAGGPNTSAHVAKYVRNASAQYDLLVFDKSTAQLNATALKQRAQRIALDVYTDAPVGTPISIGLDASSLATASNYPIGRHSNYAGVTTAQNGWQTVYFTFNAQPDVSAPDSLADHVVILFDSGKLTGNTYYVDNLRVFNVTQQPTLTTIAVAPAVAQNVAVGQKIQFAAQGKDQFGAALAVPLAWSVSGGGSIDQNGLFTATTSGAFKVFATSAGLTGKADVLVGQGLAVTTVTVDPLATFVYQGSTLQLTARGFDQTSAETAFTPTWAVTGATGVSVSASGLLTATATAAGTATVVVGNGKASATASITVRTPPVADSLAISPLASKVYQGDAQQFAFTAFDQYRNPITAPATWAVSGGGAIDATGLFAATTIGTFVVKAQVGSAVASTTVSVVPKPQNLALNKPAKASSAQGNLGAPYATDGTTSTSPDTRWASLAADPQWIRVDLGQKYDLSRVVLYWENAYGKVYDIQVADDTVQTRRVAYHEPAGDGGVDDIALAAGTSGRYVWMSGTARGTSYGYSLYELQVYGLTHQDPALKAIVVTPNFASVGAGKNTAFAAAGFDQFGNASATTPTWSASGGTISSAGVFTASAAGTYTITATSGSVSGSASLTITGSTAPPSVNLALNKPAYGSTTENGGTPAASAVDGNAGTRWSSAAADPQWLYVDLQARYTISQVVLNWETASGKAYQVQVSDDATNWTTVYSTTTGAGGVEKIAPTATGAGRYVRLYGTQRTTGYGYSLWELEVYGTAASGGPVLTTIAVTPATATVAMGATQQFAAQGKDQNGNALATAPTWAVSGGGSISASGLFTASAAGSYTVTATANGVSGSATLTVQAATPNLALKKPVRASSVENGGTLATNAVDGNAGTRWASAFSDAQWLRVDLGAPYAVNRVKLTWENAYGKDYAVEISTDTVNWTPLQTVAGNAVLVNDLTGLSGSGRYVRLRGISRGTGYGYSLYELEVYGSAVASAKASAKALAVGSEASAASSPELVLFPNPASASTTLAGVAAYPATLHVYDVRGRLLQTVVLTGPAQVLDVAPLATGWYVLRVSTPGRVQTQRLLKQ